MTAASQLRSGLAIQNEDHADKVLAGDHAAGKTGGVTHARLQDLETGTLWQGNPRGDGGAAGGLIGAGHESDGGIRPRPARTFRSPAFWR